MPAGTDLITWSPRVGATGDDRYTLPANTRITAGGSSYSSLPLLSEVNAGSYHNQFASELKRRQTDLGIAPSHGLATAGLSKASTALSANSQIDAIRSAEGSSAWSWSEAPSTGSVATASHILESRKALATDHFHFPIPDLELDSTDVNNYQTTRYHGTGYYPPTYQNNLSRSVKRAGQDVLGSSFGAYRFFRVFTVPYSYETIASATLTFDLTSVTGSGFKLRIYRSSIPLTIGIIASEYAHIDTQLAEFTPVAGENVATLSGLVQTGDDISLIFCIDHDADLVEPSANEYVDFSTAAMTLKAYT